MITGAPRKASRQTVQSAETGAEILKALARLGPSGTLTRVADMAGVAPAKAHRYLQALIVSGFATQDPVSGRYQLGPEAVAIGLAAVGRMDPVAAVTELLPSLRAEIGHTCFLAVWGNRGATVVRVSEALGEVTVVTRVGSVLPLLTSATGLLYAALLDAPEIAASDRAAAEVLAQALRTPGGPLPARLDRTRALGLSIIRGLLVPGIDAIAAPVFDASGRIVSAVTALGPNSAFDSAEDGAIAGRLRAAAAAASKSLGATVPNATPEPSASPKPARRHRASSSPPA